MDVTEQILQHSREHDADAYEAECQTILKAYCIARGLPCPAFPWNNDALLSVLGIGRADIRALLTLRAIPEPKYVPGGESWSWSAIDVHRLVRAWIHENEGP